MAGKQRTAKPRHSPETIAQACQEHRDNEVGFAILANQYDVSEQTVRNWWKAYQNKASAENGVIGQVGANVIGAVSMNAVPSPLIYSLVDGARFIGITADQLLHYGTLGKVRLCIEIHNGLIPVSSATIMETKSPSVSLGRKSHDLVRLCLLCDRVDYLLLEKEDCTRIESTGSAFREQFFGGYVIQKGESLSFKGPPELPERLQRATARHASYLNPDPLRNLLRPKKVPCFHVLTGYRPEDGMEIDQAVGGITIRRGELSVAAEELQLLANTEKDRKPVWSGPEEEFRTHDNRSSLLVNLDQVAFELWGDFNPIKAATCSTPEALTDYLMTHVGFGKLHAERAARMLLPDAKTNPIRSRERPYRAAMLQDLIALWRSVCAGRPFQKGRDEENLFKKAVEDWFNGVGLESGLAASVELKKTAAALVMPDNAPFNRVRPKR